MSGDWSERATNFSTGVELVGEAHRGLGIYSRGEYNEEGVQRWG